MTAPPLAGSPVVVFEADDFSIGQDCSWRGENYLLKLKEQIPQLKVTLFTIPSMCDSRLIEEWGGLDWVELAVHGMNHLWAECSTWTRDETISNLMLLKDFPFVKGFKAPYWLTSGGLYAALMEQEYWIADHENNMTAIPYGLPAYLLPRGHEIGGEHPWLDNVIMAHCHTHNVCENGVPERYEDLLALKEHEFAFVSEVVRPFRT